MSLVYRVGNVLAGVAQLSFGTGITRVSLLASRIAASQYLDVVSYACGDPQLGICGVYLVLWISLRVEYLFGE